MHLTATPGAGTNAMATSRAGVLGLVRPITSGACPVFALALFVAASPAAGQIAAGSSGEELVYLNRSNITVATGASHGDRNPFSGMSLEQALGNVIDAPAADAGEIHNPASTHVWVSGGPLELDFDFGVEYDLRTLHFWNYHSESHDVDAITFTFFDGDGTPVGTLEMEPLLGNTTGRDSDPVVAEDYALAFPANVRYVNAVLTGSNNQVDFNNIGFTAVRSRRERGPEAAAAAAEPAPPGPFTLRVTRSDGGTIDGALALILDASGSMLQRMQGQRRIDIAKEVLTGALRDQIPAGTPLALRVFGHRTPNACETDLEIPLRPLDPDAAIARIGGIEAQNLARTPIAASLALVEADLAAAAGRKAVVLVTDGEETCDGDPAAVIEQLREQNLEISLSIVGFAIDDPQLEREFARWAELGGGRYFAANDAAGLSDALASALATPYSVYDGGGDAIAVGVVGGEPVELAGGVYRVVVDTVPQRVFDDVAVPGASTIVLEP